MDTHSVNWQRTHGHLAAPAGIPWVFLTHTHTHTHYIHTHTHYIHTHTHTHGSAVRLRSFENQQGSLGGDQVLKSVKPITMPGSGLLSGIRIHGEVVPCGSSTAECGGRP